MSYWGKILGGVAGFAMGGPVGALFGAALGHAADQGALPPLYAATMPGLEGGVYIGPDGLGELRGHPHPVSPNRAARDEAVAARLWEVSEELTGVRFELPAAVG